MASARHTVPLLPGTPNVPLLKGTVDVGWQPVRMKGRVSVEVGLSERALKARMKWGTERFINWMIREGAQFRGDVRVDGPVPHLPNRGMDIDKNGIPIARDMPRTLEESGGMVDFIVSALFLVRPHVLEVMYEDQPRGAKFLDPRLQARPAS